MTRQTLPMRRFAQTFDLKHGNMGANFSITIGYYPDGSYGEVFIAGAKAGSEIDAIARDGAILLSLALQYGASLETIKHAITRERDGSPATIVGAVVDRL